MFLTISYTHHFLHSSSLYAFLHPDEGLPGDITVEEFTTTSISITWTEAIGNVAVYMITIEAIGPGQILDSTTRITDQPREFTFSNLQQCTEYLIKITFIGTNPTLIRSTIQRTRKSYYSFLCFLSVVLMYTICLAISWQ